MKLPCLLLAMLSATGALAAEPRAEDFAYALELKTTAPAAHYELVLPAAVLSKLTRRDWGDLRVLNAKGESQPQAWRPLPEARAVAPETRPLPIYPLPARALESGSNLRIEHRGDFTRVEILGRSDARESKETAAYLIDARSFAFDLAALRLEWSEPRLYQGRVNLEASEDLASWSMLAAAAPLLRTEFGGETLGRQRIEFAAGKHRYLRLTWPAGETRFQLNRVEAEGPQSSREPERQWQPARFAKAGETAGEYLYEVPFALPVDRLRIAFESGNHMLPIDLAVRDKDSEPWAPLGRSVFYRIEQGGQVLQNPDFSIPQSQHLQWRLKLDPRVSAGAPPALEVGWRAPRLVFLAQGEGPYRLVFGARGVDAAALPIGTLVPGFNARDETKFATALPGEIRTEGGESKREAAIDWKRWALWAALGAGVLLLAWIAFGLVKDTRKTDE